MRNLTGIILAPFRTRCHARRWLSSILFASLAGCAGLGPVALWQLSQFDVLTTDPASLSAALAVPEAIRLRDGDASLYLGYQVEGEETARVDEHFPLAITDPDADPAAPEPRATEAVYVASLPQRAAARMRTAQKDIRALKEQGIEGKGTFSISFDSGCYVGPQPKTLPLRTFLRLSPNGSFIEMVSTRNILEDLDPETASTLKAKLKPCL